MLSTRPCRAPGFISLGLRGEGKIHAKVFDLGNKAACWTVRHTRELGVGKSRNRGGMVDLSSPCKWDLSQEGRDPWRAFCVREEVQDPPVTTVRSVVVISGILTPG